MPVSGKEEQPGVLSRPLHDISAGIPLKKRRLLLVPPPSPPRHEAQSSPNNETDNEKAQSPPCIDSDNPKNIDGSCSDVKKDESLSDLKTSIPESVPTSMMIGGDEGLKCLNTKETVSDVIGKESALDLKNMHVIDSDQKPLSNNDTPLDNIPDTSGFHLPGDEGKTQSKQDSMPQTIESSSPGHGKLDASRLSFSLSKEMGSMDKTATDGETGKGKSMGMGNDDLSPIRMNWDLNTPMDSWDGSDGDTTVPAFNRRSCTTTDPNDIQQFLNSADSGSTFINKGKQLIETEEHMSVHSSRLIASSIQGNHELEDSLRLTLGVASQEMEMDKGLSAEVASRKYVSDSSLQNAKISGSIGYGGIVKSEPFGDNSKKTSVVPIAHPRGFIDPCSLKRESTERHDKKTADLSISITEKLSGQTSIKAEPVLEDNRELPQAVQHGLLKTDRFHYGGSSSELSASVGISNQSEFMFHTSNIQVSDCNAVQPTAEVGEPTQKLFEASVHETANAKTDTKISNNSEISQLKISNNRNNMRVNGESSVIDEEKLKISVETTECEFYGSDCESDGNQGFATRFNTQDICTREEDDFEDGEVREHLHTRDTNVETLGIECAVKLVNSGANSSVIIDGQLGNNTNDNTLGNPGERIVDNNISIETDAHLNNQDATLTKILSDGIVAEVDTSQIRPLDRSRKDAEENGIACNRTMDTIGEATGENVHSDDKGNKVSPSSSKVDVTLNRDGACIESTSGGNKSRIITLPRASVTSPFETKSVSGGSLSYRSGGREREETGLDRHHGFVRERFQEPHFRNLRNNYTRGRGGRFAGRMGNPRVDWESDREFGGRSSSDHHHFNQNKWFVYNDTDIEPSNYPIARDDTNRGRKPFHPPFSRRKSPGGQDDPPPTRDTHMLHKVPRNASPCRRDNDEFVGVRNERFSKPLRKDTMNSSYGHSNSGFNDRDDGQFVRGNRNFSTGQHRFYPRVRSKSPIGLRISPGGPWSPSRRSPDRFKVLPKVVQRRPYGPETTRSPDHPCFPEDNVARRRGGGSPSYVSRATTNDPRDVDSGSEHGHPRPFNSRRSPSDRVFNRSSGRFDVNFFSRSSNSREVNGEGRNQSFRPPYIADTNNRRFNVNDGPHRPFRFRSDSDTDYTGRNMGGGDREFDDRIKNRPAVAPRHSNY